MNQGRCQGEALFLPARQAVVVSRSLLLELKAAQNRHRINTHVVDRGEHLEELYQRELRVEAG